MMSFDEYRAMRDRTVLYQLANPVVDPAYFSQTLPDFLIASGTDAYTVTKPIISVVGYYQGMYMNILFTNANTGPATIQVNGWAVVPIVKDAGDPLIAGDLAAGGIYNLQYDGTNFQIVGGASGITIIPSALTKVDDTNVTLTLGGSPAVALLAATSLTLGWSGQLGLSRGGTNADLSATGGTSKFLRQNSVGAAITVVQPAVSDLSDGSTLATKVYAKRFAFFIS